MFYSLVVGLGILSSVNSLTYPIVDTGQVKFSNDARHISAPQPGDRFYGQDAHYNGNQPSYRDNGDGTVTDLVTGLMWQKSMAAKMYLNQAYEYARDSRLGGYNDWRLPTMKELYSLTLFSGTVSMGTSAGATRFIDTNYFEQPTGNTAQGEREIDSQVLSATDYKGYVFGRESCNFGMNFVDGRIKCYPTRNHWYFRLVRGTTQYGANDFTANGDGTVSDSSTGLTWMHEDSKKAMDWEAALAYCENLQMGGQSDWRLPNAKELHSIVDYSHSPQLDRSPAIDPIFETSLVSIPGGWVNFPYFWTSTTHNDGPMPKFAAYISFGEAVGVMNRWLMDVHGAGSQRSDPKAKYYQRYPQFMGPQGDMRVVDNYVRCVRGSGLQ